MDVLHFNGISYHSPNMCKTLQVEPMQYKDGNKVIDVIISLNEIFTMTGTMKRYNDLIGADEFQNIHMQVGGVPLHVPSA